MLFYQPLTAASLTLIMTGLVLLVPASFTVSPQTELPPSVTTATPTPSANPTYVAGMPRRIVVPSVTIAVDVLDGFYDTQTDTWTLTEESAFFATPTDPANSQAGNTFIYGHNSKKIFGNLLQLQAGAEATVTTDNGYEFIYTFTASEALDPRNVSPLAYSGTPRLMLQTCSGVWNQTRQMFYFDLKEYRQL